MDSYAAGLIDGEGYIGIQESGGSFQVRLKVCMTDKGLPALTRMHRLYGGTVRLDRLATDSRREAHVWVVTGRAAVDVIEAVRPFLAVKAEAADVAVQFQAMVDAAPRLPNGRAKWTTEMRHQAAVLVRRIQEANRRGPDPAPPHLPPGKPLAVHRWGMWWEPEEDLFGPVEFTGRLPRCGRMVAGHIFALPSPTP